MRRLALTLLVFLPSLPVAAAEPLTLVENGRSEYVICVPDEATPVELTAARELQEYLAQATGARLEVKPEQDVPPTARQVVVGAARRLNTLAADVRLPELGDDGILLRTAGDALLLAGSPPRGTLYAVYTFLEDVIGVKWWTSSEMTVPSRPTLTVPPLDVRHAPPFKSREAFYRDAFQPAFAARLKLNGHHHGIPAEYGGHLSFCGFVHTFYPLLPPERYFAEHPEWYSEIEGQRSTEHAQLCLTNETMRKELVAQARERLRAQPDAKFLSVSQNDWHGRCQCAACRAVEEEEGSPAGPLVRFVNAVAEDLEREFPELLVETLAYQYTRQPPEQTRPRDNVVIRLCSIECSFVQPLGSGPQNEPFRKDIEGWAAVAPQLFVWDYVTNFSNYILPHANLRVLAANIRFFADHRVVGLFEQGDAGSGVGDFVALRAWLIAHLMWNPAADERALIAEFLRGYYGPAAPHLQAYLDVIHDAAERSGVYLRCFMSDTRDWLKLADLNQATRHFDDAVQAVANDPELAARVRRERLVLDHAWLQRYQPLRWEARLSGGEFLGPADQAAAVEDYIRTAREFGVGQWREGRAFAEYELVLRSGLRPAGGPPELCRGLSEDRWLAVPAGQFSLARPGELAALVEDKAASDGQAARMPGDHVEWAVQVYFADELKRGNPWRVYAVARCEATAETGRALTLGLYHAADRQNLAAREVTIAESRGAEYRTFDLGAHPLDRHTYLWAAPAGRPGEVQAVFLDRVFLIREEPAGESTESTASAVSSP